MKRAVLLLSVLPLGACLAGAMHLSGKTAPALTLPITHSEIATGTLARAIAAVVPLKNDDDDRVARRHKVQEEEAGTYIGEILRERDSSLARWPDRRATPLTVWIQPASPVSDFTSTFVDRVREAFKEWDGLRLPVHFSFITDSAKAEVHVNWIDRFKEPISGRTRWTRDDNWTITDANIVLAVHHSQGESLDGESMRAMALHEIGHLLGLDHTADSTSIMAPRVRVRQLSAADRATARLLYSLPPGRM